MSLLGKVGRQRHATTAVDARSAEKLYADLTDNFVLKVALENSSTRIIQNAKRL
jgi:hypothetical protein